MTITETSYPDASAPEIIPAGDGVTLNLLGATATGVGSETGLGTPSWQKNDPNSAFSLTVAADGLSAQLATIENGPAGTVAVTAVGTFVDGTAYTAAYYGQTDGADAVTATIQATPATPLVSDPTAVGSAPSSTESSASDTASSADAPSLDPSAGVPTTETASTSPTSSTEPSDSTSETGAVAATQFSGDAASAGDGTTEIADAPSSSTTENGSGTEATSTSETTAS